MSRLGVQQLNPGINKYPHFYWVLPYAKVSAPPNTRKAKPCAIVVPQGFALRRGLAYEVDARFRLAVRGFALRAFFVGPRRNTDFVLF